MIKDIIFKIIFKMKNLLRALFGTVVSADLQFVFECVRHGARAPITDTELSAFLPTTKGGLTPEGKRQRYLLGKHSRTRYTIDNDLLSPNYSPEEVWLQSTDVQRTMQSGYSEIMGMYPPNSGAATMTTGMTDTL